MTEDTKTIMNTKGDLIEIKDVPPLTKLDKRLFRFFAILLGIALIYLTFHYLPWVGFVFYMLWLPNIGYEFLFIIVCSMIIGFIGYLWRK